MPPAPVHRSAKTPEPESFYDLLNVILLVNCGDPVTPTNGSLGSYVHTREGATVTYMCNDGFRPSAIFSSTCVSTARWTPDPEQHNCTFIQGTVKCVLQIHI